MDNQPQQLVSVVSEIPDLVRQPAHFHFVAALFWGTTAATLTVLLPFAGWDPMQALANIVGGMFFVGIFAGLFTLAGMLAIGLPTTALLRAVNAEHRFAYAAIGGVAGLSITAISFQLPPRFDVEALVFPSAGGLAGFTAALRWGRWREALARYRQQMAEAQEHPRKRSNPIHDLIH